MPTSSSRYDANRKAARRTARRAEKGERPEDSAQPAVFFDHDPVVRGSDFGGGAVQVIPHRYCSRCGNVTWSTHKFGERCDRVGDRGWRCTGRFEALSPEGLAEEEEGL